MSIPVLDLAGALAPGSARGAEVGARLRAAATTSGFFYLRNHGVDPAAIERQFAMAQQLLELPAQTRQALDMRRSPAMRGFENLKTQTLDKHAHPDLKESFYCGLAYPDDHPYVVAGYPNYGGNQWPREVPEAASVCEEYIQSMLGLSRRLMQILALSLGLPEGYFDGTSDSPLVTLRMVRYPAHPEDADDRTFGAGAHTDWGAITILAQDRHGGLEVRMPDGSWVAAPPMADCFIVNLGDMIPRWTNGLYRSNLHRVRNTHSGGAPRYSIPFFYQPDYHVLITPVPGTLPSGEIPLLKPCTVGEHLKEMYVRTYGLQAKQG